MTNMDTRPRQRNGSAESLTWRDFFSRELYIERDTDGSHIVYHAYITPPTGSGPLFVMHHGAGSSGLSFAACSSEIRKILPEAGILSLDARHHGSTTVESIDGSPVELDYRLETLSQDLLAVIRGAQTQMVWETLPDLVLVGHSLGGAVITDVAKGGELGAKVLAYAVLDVVEGSAMDALQSMDTYLSTRPTRFPSLSSAIDWQYVCPALKILMDYSDGLIQFPLPNNPQHHLRPSLSPLSPDRRKEPLGCIPPLDMAHKPSRHKTLLGRLVQGPKQEIYRSQGREITPASRHRSPRQGIDDCPNAREIFVAGIASCGPFYSGGSAGEDGEVFG